ncbi:MAG: nucleoside triphosphate pyrophosphatase [Candidatus Eisenbacteria bacterium]
MEDPRLILASTSKYRRELLARLQLPFACAVPSFRETKRAEASPEEAQLLAEENARGKAVSLREAFPDRLILGSDQVCECEGRVLGKSGTDALAVEQLAWLSGRDHRLHTAVVLLDAASMRIESAVVTTHLRIRTLSRDQLASYVAQEHPVDAAGSYYSEGLGIALFEHLRGDDPTAIIGLPLVTVCRLLEQFGVSPFVGGNANP